MRKLFSDGTNSISHVAFGLVTYTFPFVLPAYVVYQVKELDENTRVDFAEYFIGMGLAYMYYKNKK
jgi:hypothetical protein